MFEPIKNGIEFEFGGIPSWTPPIPKKSEILFSSLPKKAQMWKREPLPDYFRELRIEEKRIQQEEWKLVQKGEQERIYHFNPILEAYRRKQWQMRLNGVWFMNNGEPIYLTGAWWYYLQWCRFDHKENGGYPTFYMSQRKRFYFKQSCFEDEFCLGYLVIGARGFGKSTEETGLIMESITRGPKRRRVALQSKSEKDAQDKIFKGKFVPMYKSLPDFFKPEDNHGTNPETRLSFALDAKRGAKAQDVKALDFSEFELENAVFFVSAKEKALDGDTLAEIFSDELGKTDPKKEADVNVRQAVNRFCVYRNNRKIGMIRATTTVEEMNEGGDECHAIWKDSDITNARDDNGFTLSGLYRLFISCIETATNFADEYGVIDEKKAMQFQVNARKAREHDSRKLSSWIRKNPIYEEEAFIKDASKSVFNVFILTKRLQELNSMKRAPYLRGNFYWVNGVDGLVDFKQDDHAGRFLVSKILDVKLKADAAKPGQILANQMGFYTDTEDKKQWQPKNNKYFRMGTDPIKYAKTKDPRASKMGIHGFEMYSPAMDHDKEVADWLSHNLMFEYLYRPDDPEDAYEDCIMAMRYYGCSILPETNIKDLVLHLNSRGYGECVIYRNDYNEDFISGKQDDAGLTSVPEVIHSYITRIISFVNKHGHRIKFPRTIESLLAFEPEHTTLYDATVSMGYTLFAAEAPLDLETEVQDVGDWFDSYDDSGDKSSLLEEGDSLLEMF